MPKLQSIPKQEELSSALAAFNLTESELTVYYSALALGTRPATQLAKHAGLNRPYTYDILFRLSEKGLVVQSVKNSVKQFSCVPPEELVELLHRRERELVSQKAQLLRALPLLQEFRNTSSAQPGFRYFRGVDGIKRMLDQALETSERVVYSFVQQPVCGSKLESEESAFSKDFRRRLRKRDIHYFGVVSSGERSDPIEQPNSTSDQKSDQKLVALRHLSPEHLLPLEAFVYGQRVAILPNPSDFLGFVIENEALADSARSIHDLLWRTHAPAE